MFRGWTILVLTLSLVTAQRARRKSCVVENKETLKCNYFPVRVSEWLSRVRVINFIGPNEEMVMNSTTFNIEGWRHVKYVEISNSLSNSVLHLKAETFLNLKTLDELQLHLDLFSLDPDTFVGLHFVKSLDVSDCFRLSYDDLLQSLNGTDKLPDLTKLTMSRLNQYHRPNIIDKSFGQALQHKKLTYLDLSNSEITELHFDVFEYLRYLNFVNMSGATIGDTFQETFNFSHLKDINIDLSYASLPHRMRPPPGKFIISNVVMKNPTVHTLSHLALLDAKIVNMSSIVPEISSIWVKNTTVISDKPEKSLIQSIVAKNNNLKYLDIHIHSFHNSCIACSLEKIDISYNGLQFMNFLSVSVVAPNVKTLNLSFNQLFEMAKNDGTMFAVLFKGLAQLQFVSLSSNNLETIPDNMFEDNSALEIIDLSGNKLSQVTFFMFHLNKLRILDLQHNFIHVLNEMSLNHLDSILENTKRTGTKASVLLNFNPLSCADCDTKAFIIWLLKTSLVSITSQNLQCMSKNGDLSIINEDVVHTVQSICLRNTIITASTASCVCVIVIFITIGLGVHKYWKRKRMLEKKKRVIDFLRNGEGQYEFVAFLTYNTESESDSEFVENYILDELNSNLQRKTEIERGLICTGERHFTAGSPIYCETDRCFNRAAVIIFVFSNDFRFTAETYFILDLVLRSEKPIIFMLKGHVDEHNDEEEGFLARLRRFCHERTQIQWHVDDGQYTLGTSWDDVCNFVLDHAARNL